MAAAFPFLTTYDPPGTSEGSLDPLGLYQIADQLAMQLVPAVRERILRIRFLTAMAVGSLVIEDLEGDPRHPDATPYLVWEWLVVEALTREMGDDPSIRGVPGTGVTRAALAQHKYVDARSYGASAIDDGCDAVDSPLSNCSNIPVEAIDMEHDFFRVVEYALVRGSGGKGEYCGGLGMRRVYEVLADGVEYQSYSDRFTIPPQGLFGGEDGGAAFTCVLRGNEKIMLGSKTSFQLAKGDRLVMSTGGGRGLRRSVQALVRATGVGPGERRRRGTVM